MKLTPTNTLTTAVLVVAVFSGCTTTYDVQRLVEVAAWDTAYAAETGGPHTIVVSYFTLDGHTNRLSDFLIDGLTAQLASAIREEEIEGYVVNRRQLDQTLEELAFQASELSGPAMAKVGGKLGADLILTGSITPMGNVFVLNVQLIEIETGVVQAGFSYEFWADPELTK